jgi:hypothetical protein
MTTFAPQVPLSFNCIIRVYPHNSPRFPFFPPSVLLPFFSFQFRTHPFTTFNFPPMSQRPTRHHLPITHTRTLSGRMYYIQSARVSNYLGPKEQLTGGRLRRAAPRRPADRGHHRNCDTGRGGEWRA